VNAAGSTSLLQAARAWASRQREPLLDAGLLLLALNLPHLLLGLPRTPWLAQAAVLVAFALLTSPRSRLVSGTWPRYRKQLPGFLATAAAGVLEFVYWFDLPPLHWAFAPVWLALTAGTRLPLRSLLERGADWLRQQRLAAPLGDALLLVGFSWSTPRWSQQPGPTAWAVALLILAWLWLHRAPPPSTLRHRWLWARLGLAFVWGLLWLPTGLVAAAPAAVFAGWLALALLAFHATARRLAAETAEGFDEILRRLGLLALTILFFSPFFRAGVHGSGDALYYATFLADALEQFRAGVFPVFVGQSEYQFNGAVIPIRIAPGFQYAGGLIDLLTCRLLNPMSVQNLLVTVTALLAVLGTYSGLRRLGLAGSKAWWLSVLYLTCPGVMGLAFNSDLYMSWLTVPWVSLSLFTALHTFEHSGPWLYARLGAQVALTWWFHPPIAVWLTLSLAVLQVARFALKRAAGWTALTAELAAGATAFLAIASYPLVSATLYPADPVLGASGGFVVPANHVLQQLLETFPQAWLPLSDLGRRLSDFQLGYGLLALSLIALPAAWHGGHRDTRVLLLLAGLLLLLLVPIPWLNLTLWQLVPNLIRTITNIWAMQRLYLLMAGMLVVVLALTWVRLPAARSTTASLRWAGFACLWSLVEALKFLHGSAATVTPASASPVRLAPENITLTRYSYGLFSRKPAYFTHGTTDPAMENRLLADDFTLLDSNYAQAARLGLAPQVFRFAVVDNHLETTAPLTLQPGRRYLLSLPAGAESLVGTLVLEGRRLQRVYALPEYGEAQSFGLGGSHNPWLPLHTTDTTPESVRVLFESSVPVDLSAIAGRLALSLTEYPADALPVQVRSLIPYQARVTSPTPAWLETPRMHQRGYAATVNGQVAHVQPSPEGLVCVRVPAGVSDVKLAYVAPAGLQAAFWLSFSALVAALVLGVASLVRSVTAPPPATATPAAAAR
jgi:hypothetical protein